MFLPEDFHSSPCGSYMGRLMIQDGGRREIYLLNGKLEVICPSPHIIV